MNDKDKEAFEKWWGNIYSNQIEWRDWQGCDIALNGKEDMRYGWQAACEYKQKEIAELGKDLEWFDANEPTRFYIKQLQAEKAELQEQLKSCIFVYEEQKDRLIKKLKIAVKLLTSLRSLIELSIDSEHNYESWLSRNKEALKAINGDGV